MNELIKIEINENRRGQAKSPVCRCSKRKRHFHTDRRPCKDIKAEWI